MNSKIKTYIDASQKVSHRLGRIVPCLGTHRFMPWDASFHALGRIVSLLLLFLMLVFGDVNVWAQTPPVEITTDEDEINHTEKLYLIQTNQFQSFYMIPNGTNVSTANLPNEQMLWYFKDAGEDNNGNQYYYIVNKNKKYICHGGGTSNTDASRGITLVEKTSSNEGRCKFKLIEIGTEGFYNIRTITDQKYYALNKRSGSVSSQYPIRLTDSQYASDLNSKWKFIRFNGTFTWPDPPFTPSTDTEKHYYKINSKISTNYYISTNTDNKVTFASTQSDNMVWYFKEVPSNLAGESSSWFKYYYIVNQNSDDQYMYYDGTATDGTTQSDVVSLKEKSEGIEDRYQFIIVQTAKTTTNDAPVECYMIVPKLLREVLWDYNSIGPDAVSDGSVIDIIKGRVNDDTKDNYAHVTFASIDQCAEPTISLDPSTNEVVIISSESGSSIYYTISDGIVDAETLPSPTRTDNPYSSPIPPSTVTIKAVTVKNNYSKAKSNPVTKTIVYMPTITLEDVPVPWIYDKTAKEPSISSVMVGETSIPSTYYDITYTDNINAGTASVTIRDNSNSGYLIYGTTNFTISQAPLTVTAKPKSIAYGDAPANNGVEYDGFVGGETSTVLGGSLDYDYSYTQYDDVGDNYTITPKGLTSNNYNISYVAGTLTVNPKALTITADAKEKAYGDDDPALTYTFEGLVGSDAITGALSRDAGENVGTYPINQNTLTASSNYTISYTGANLTINPKPLTITAKSKTITYGEEPTNDGVTYSEFAPGEDASDLIGTLTYAYNYSQYGDAGEYSITPSGLTGDNYDISYVAGTLTVNPKEVGLVWSETTSFVYDANSHAPTASATGMVNGDEIGVTVSGEQINAGDHIATASALTGNKAGNYALPAANTKAFSITPVALAVTAKNHIIIYGDTPGNNGVEYSGFVGEDNASMLGGSLDYAYSYAQYGDVGDDYTITPSGLTSTNYIISYHNGTLTVKKKTLGLNWTNTSFTYDREEHLPTVTIVGMVNGDEVSVTVTGPSAINAGDYIATASNLSGDKVDNYRLPTVTTQTFTISPKSLGDGDLPAEDITIKLTSEGELEYVKDGEITLTADDYTYEIHTEGSDQIVAVTGIGNYTGTLRGIYAKPKFYDVDGEGAGKAAAVYMSSRDINTFEGVNAYTVKSVNTFLGLLTVSKLEYIPKGVPVLLLSESEATGFVVSEKDEEIADISERTVNNNLLKMADADIPVETAQAYMFYLGEFVLTKAGTIKSGKFYILNPDYTDTSAGSGISSARRSLTIVEEEVTGMTDIPNTGNKSADDVWYTLDGRCLNGKPARKGLYIHQGRKTVIK
ncbi:MAG: hypothetical protein J6V87_01895 [Prevotella sp.]|nr:hypothetical protein [Prevotella sp.]